MATKMSRRCIPYSPFRKELKDVTLALVSMAGVHLKSQTPFDLESDSTTRVIEGDVDPRELMVTHAHYPHQDADEDIDVVFPISRARQLVDEGFLGGLNKQNYSLGYAQDLRKIYDEVAPRIADDLYRSATDIVLLTAG